MTSKSFLIFLLVTLVVSTSGEKQIVGGATEVDPAKVPEITELLKHNLHKLEGEALVKLVEVQKLTQQVVSGMLYTITGVFEDKDKAQFACEITIWERAWLDEPDKLTFALKSKSALVADGNSGSVMRNNYFLLFSAFALFKLLL